MLLCLASLGHGFEDLQLSPVGAVEEFGTFDNDRVDIGDSTANEHDGRCDCAETSHRESRNKCELDRARRGRDLTERLVVGC